MKKLFAGTKQVVADLVKFIYDLTLLIAALIVIYHFVRFRGFLALLY